MNHSVAIIGTRGYPSYYGGFETLVRQLSPFLADQGWDVTVYGRDGATRINDDSLDKRVISKTTRGIESKSLSTLSYGLTSTLDTIRQKPDVALVMNVANGYWLPLLKARGIPSIVNVDGIEWEREKWGRAAKLAFKIGARLTAKFADDLIFDSKEIERRWKEDFHRAGHFIPYGATETTEQVPSREFEPGSYALMVARFVPENTVEEFFEAAEVVSTRWNVAIVGSSGYGGHLDARARELSEKSERIHWYGHVSDDAKLFSLWRNAGVYFHGHSVGGTNPALVQAMACGAPTVARDTVFNREVLGPNGIFVAPNPNDIAATLEQVLSDAELRTQIATYARERQQCSYTWQKVCQDYNDALLNLMTT